MKNSAWAILLALATNCAIAEPSNAPPHLAPALIELADQFGKVQRLSFPATNLTLLTIADRTGSRQIQDWVAAIKARHPARLDIRGLADVSAVPGFLHEIVRRKFQKQQSYPVMLDWSGNTIKAFRTVSNHANILLIDTQGRVLQRFIGEATPAALRELFVVLDDSLPGSSSAAPPTSRATAPRASCLSR